MKTMARGAGLALLLVGSTAGCQWTWPSQWSWTPQPTPSSQALVGGYFIPVQLDCGKRERRVHVVHVVIANVHEAQLNSSTLSHYHSDVHGIQREGDMVSPPPTKLTNYLTYVDFEAGPYLVQKSDVVLIELQLTDPNYTFWPGTNATVITSKAAHGEMFCLREAMVVLPGARTVRFYAKWVPTADGKPVIGAYNFNVVKADGKRHNLTVDPHVRNEG